MPLKFARLALSIICTSILLLGLALRIGISTPASAHTSLLTRNSCELPCVFDIIPGVTLRNDAMLTLERQQLSYSFLSQNQPASFTTRESRNSRSTLALLNFGSQGDMRVGAVHVYQMGDGNELGILSDYLLADYQPTRVLANCQNVQRVYLMFDAPLLLLLEVEQRLLPDTPVRMVASASGQDAVTPVGGYACATDHAWSGFAALWVYQSVS